MSDPLGDSLGLASLWAQADWVIRLTALALFSMSIASWYLIVVKSWRMLHNRQTAAVVEDFWRATSLAEGLRVLRQGASDTSFEALALQARSARQHCARHGANPTLGGSLDAEEFLTRALRHSISQSTARLESGLTLLASIASTAPFIGLFGTVWGIYHALVNIGMSGQATLDQVAGPVGEALIMTAFGLFVAIPAVLAYNAFTRANRIELAALDAFAHDLHAYFTTGARMAPGQGNPAQRARANAQSPAQAKESAVAAVRVVEES